MIFLSYRINIMELKEAVKVDSIFDLSEATDYIENKVYAVEN